MTDEPQDTGTDEPDELEQSEPEQGEPEEDWQPPSREEHDKLIARLGKRERMVREYRDKLNKLEGATPTTDEPDPVAVADARTVRQAARTQLATAGVTDKDDQLAVLDLLNLAGVDVDERGDADEDAISDAIATLRRVFAPANGRARAPRLDTRDKAGAGGTPRSRDEERWARIAGRR
jgi:hypothetical protein